MGIFGLDFLSFNKPLFGTETVFANYNGMFGNSSPTASFSVNPTSGNTSTIFNFDASNSSDIEDPATVLQVRWDWENDGVWDTQYSTTKMITHLYTSEGTKIIKMEIKDTGGLTNSTTNQITVSSVNTPPTAFLVALPSSGFKPLNVLLDASSSISGAVIGQYKFIFGDGQTYTETPTSNDGNFDGKTNHVYLNAGNYTASVTVRDQLGREDSDSVEIQVMDNSGLNRIVFVSNREGAFDIFIMNTDGSNIVNLTKDVFDYSNPSWSPDGTKIAFSSDREGSRDIYVMNTDGSNIKRLTNHIFFSNNYEGGIDWSPDGTKIAFSSDLDDLNSEIYVMNSDGSNITRLTNNDNDRDVSPVWSPDGTKIAFSSNREQGSSNIFVMDSDGSNVTNLTNDDFVNREPAWSPGGFKIAFVSRRDPSIQNNEIYVMNVDGSNITNITDSEESEGDPAWSSDGTKISFNRFINTGNRDIFIMSANGTNQTNITNNFALDIEPSWSP